MWGAVDIAIRLALFAIPASAPGWRALLWRGAAAAALLLALFLLSTEGRFSLSVQGGDANIAAGIVLVYGLPAVIGGIVARAVSLGAARLGHRRPWSLWIEALAFISGPAVLDLVLGIA